MRSGRLSHNASLDSGGSTVLPPKVLWKKAQGQGSYERKRPLNNSIVDCIMGGQKLCHKHCPIQCLQATRSRRTKRLWPYPCIHIASSTDHPMATDRLSLISFSTPSAPTGLCFESVGLHRAWHWHRRWRPSGPGVSSAWQSQRRQCAWEITLCLWIHVAVLDYRCLSESCRSIIIIIIIIISLFLQSICIEHSVINCYVILLHHPVLSLRLQRNAAKHTLHCYERCP